MISESHETFAIDESDIDERTKKIKVGRALQILHIRQSKFQSLYDARRFGKVSTNSIIMIGNGQNYLISGPNFFSQKFSVSNRNNLIFLILI